MKSVLAMTCLGLALLPLLAQARPAMEMERLVEKEVRMEQNGKTIIKRIPAENASRGDVLIFTIRYRNAGTEQATRVEARNAIPLGMGYVLNSASGANSEIRFSVDGGKTFLTPGELKAAHKSVPPRAEDYTHIQWMIGSIGPGERGELGYRVRML